MKYKVILIIIINFLALFAGSQKKIVKKEIEIYKKHKYIAVEIHDLIFFKEIRDKAQAMNLNRHCSLTRGNVFFDFYNIENFNEKEQVEIAHLLKVDKNYVKCFLTNSIEEFDLEI